MSRITTGFMALIVVGTIAGCSTYGRMEDAWDAYEPPLLAKVSSVTTVPPKAESDTPSSENTVIEALEAASERWSTYGRTPSDVAARLGVKAEVIQSFSDRADDVDALSTILGRPWTLQTVEALGVLRNPASRSADQRLRAAVESIGQVSALDAVLKQYSTYTQAQMLGVGPMKGADPIALKFPFPGVTALKGAVAEANIKIAAENRAAAYRDTISSIQETYWQLRFTHQAKQITKETLGLLRHLEEVATTRYKSGKTSYQDVVKVQIQRQTLAEEFVNWQQRQQAQQERLKALLDLGSVARLARPVMTPPPLQVPARSILADIAIERRQELRGLRTKVDKMAHMILMAETMLQPTYGPNLSRYDNRPVQAVGSGATKATFNVTTTAQRGAGLPKMPWYGINDAYLRETRQKLLALRSELADAEAQTRFMVEDSWRALDQAVREEKLYRRSVVDLSETSLSVSTREYEAGKIPFAEVISSHTTWLKSRLTLARKQSDIGEARARLLRVVGGIWPQDV